MARPTVALISRAGAARAALAVIEEGGLESFNFALVARQLGVSAPSLYHHFDSRAALLEEVARTLLDEIGRADVAGPSFEERLICRCKAARATLLEYPNAAPLILRFFPRHLLLGAYERTIGAAPYPTWLRMAVIDAVERYTFGAALFEASARARGVRQMPDVDPVLYPSLSRAIADNPFADDELFAESLRLFLAGARQRAGE